MRHSSFKRILSGTLTAVLLFGILAAGLPVRATEAAQTVSVTDSRSGGEIKFSERDAVALS